MNWVFLVSSGLSIVGFIMVMASITNGMKPWVQAALFWVGLPTFATGLFMIGTLF